MITRLYPIVSELGRCNGLYDNNAKCHRMRQIALLWFPYKLPQVSIVADALRTYVRPMVSGLGLFGPELGCYDNYLKQYMNAIVHAHAPSSGPHISPNVLNEFSIGLCGLHEHV